jgi:hypothetical protein
MDHLLEISHVGCDRIELNHKTGREALALISDFRRGAVSSAEAAGASIWADFSPFDMLA